MMKRIGITQRVVIVPGYNEVRDCLDQKWLSIAQSLDSILFPLPCLARDTVSTHMEALQLDALILSGGNSLSHLDPSANDRSIERDAFEYSLIDFAIERAMPLLGVCRGMQVINVHLGGQLNPIQGHAGCRHDVTVAEEFADLVPANLNSFHDWSINADGLAQGLEPIVHDTDGNVEGFYHKEHAVAGIMWHPEREHPANPKDIQLLTRFLS